MILRALLLLSILAVPSLVSAMTCAHEPTGSSVLTDWPFNSLTGSGWGDAGGSHAIVSDGTAPESPSNVYRQTFYTGMPAGISPANDYYQFPGTTREVFLCFWWQASAGYQQHGSNRTKIIFLSDTGGNPLFFYMGGAQNGPPGVYYIGMQHQNSDICNDHLSGFPGICGTWDIASGQTFTAGQWVQLELHARLSTTTTSKDGVLEYWVNGALGRRFTNWNSGQNPFSSVPIVPIWGGVGGTKTQTDYFSYDHMRISVQNCPAPCGSPTGDTTPPGQVTSVTVSQIN